MPDKELIDNPEAVRRYAEARYGTVAAATLGSDRLMPVIEATMLRYGMRPGGDFEGSFDPTLGRWEIHMRPEDVR